MTTFSKQELDLLRSSDQAEDAPRRSGRGRCPFAALSPRRGRRLKAVTLTVEQSVAALSAEDREWMSREGYLIPAPPNLRKRQS